MVTLKFNLENQRFICYENEKEIKTLTCGDNFTLFSDDEREFISGKIEHNKNGYYFICNEGHITYLYDGMKGTL